MYIESNDSGIHNALTLFLGSSASQALPIDCNALNMQYSVCVYVLMSMAFLTNLYPLIRNECI